MKKKLYIYFPETDAAFELLGQNPQSYQELVYDLLLIKGLLKKDGNFSLFYDSANIESFLNTADGLVEGEYLGKIRKQLQQILGGTSIDINLPVLRDSELIYANWHPSLEVIPSPFVFAESSESTNLDTDFEKTVCLCLGNSYLEKREHIYIVSDKLFPGSVPALHSIEFISNSVGFVHWLTTVVEGNFTLKGNSDFEPLDKYWGKERIYRQIATGDHWYFDYFHKDNKVHYEVFDSTGDTYKGEANMEGDLIVGSNEGKGNRKISNIL